jgi:predicted TPR repeat methyltransferase
MEDAATTEREISFDEVLQYAVRFQQNGQLREAEDVYRRLREVAPDDPRLLHYSGVLAHQQGRSEEAKELIERSLATEPHADGYSNLGIVCKALGRIDEAIAAYERAIALEPRHANAHNNLGVLLRSQDRKAEAEAAYRKAVELEPEYVEAWHNLGMLLGSMNRRREAVLCQCRVTTLCRHHAEARRLLAMSYCVLGEVDKAVELFKEWVELEPDNPIARHMLAAVSGHNVPPRAADECVEAMFDRFAENFETILLDNLAYRAPKIVAALLEDSGRRPAKTLDVLDAGCGTGLCGPLLAPYARRLTGVDLSARMLERAKDKQVYDELVKGELTALLRSRPAAFDVIVSADTLVYFGALEGAVAAGAAALRPGGVLIFTLEELVDGGGSDYRLETHGRYTHSRHYVDRLLRQACLEPTIVHAELRFESGLAVAGLAVRAHKPDGATHA